MKIKLKSSKNFTLFIIMMVIFIILSIAMPSKFLTGINLQSMASQFPEFGLLALAMMMAMITGGIDLSVVSVSNFTGVIAALILADSIESSTPAGVAILLAVLAVIAVSIVCGLVNGLLIAGIGVPPILATLGTQGLFLGLAIVITQGHSVSGFPESFMALGSGTVLGIPVPFIIFVLIALLVSVLLNRTRQGFNMYMVGSNPTVAKFSGVNNTKVLINTYILTAVLAGLASLIMISRANSMRPGYGTAYLLQAILVAVLGGTDPDGGFGTVKGLVMGIIILQITQSGLNIMSFSPFFKKFIWGFALLAIMVINYLLHKYNERKRVMEMNKLKAAGQAAD
ncbi:MAG: ABC transporter permease [Spirochaetales bacterium]|uniref:ABC transporter permease n=1 Tax=Candidatus Thalassospirochaeta sargassi TaxID=3119039 RepID=A0AAJ1IH16_9SPIO|nr:ABC transporter permease [Spirochaetales bacterium]